MIGVFLFLLVLNYRIIDVNDRLVGIAALLLA